MMLLDPYERRARLTPGLLVLAPIALTLVVLGIRENPVIAACAGLLPAVGGPFALASIVRDRGVALQESLFAKWGGPPTRRFLQNTNTERSSAQRIRWREDVEAVLGISLPTSEEEESDAEVAAAAYDVAVSQLRTKTRGLSGFELVFEENRNYGYWRNLRAMRPFGVLVASSSLVVVAAAAVLAAWGDALAATPRSWFVLGALLSLLWLVFWILVPTERAVKRASDRYAERLFESTGNLR